MLPRLLDSLDLQAFTDAARQVPYQQISSEVFPGLDVWVRRDDLIDPLISGNKAYKLIFNLIEARNQGAKTIVTCGGAWSNHIHAVAAAGARFGFKAIGIIRGERPAEFSATLQDAQRFGMELKFVTRAQYRRRGELDFLRDLGLENEGVYFVPEGGANLAGVKGVQLLGRVIEETAPVAFDQVWVACGTGATFAGLYSSIQNCSVIGVEVLKAADSILNEACYWVSQAESALPGGQKTNNHSALAGAERLTELRKRLLSQFHFGGYGRYPKELRDFHMGLSFEGVPPFEPVYMLKLLYALQKGSGEKELSGGRVLILHSGGLQGRRGFND
ncbi:1-aminocyclopropane-1-carboxylate deaminase/D-cysteine desulfhydrase [Microbulbifer epialgicus]|uniref:1-aminocyclopropane-1-carboxylate deaminase/D-cysteine desulfhydrase n=1 Tax=Microbulbifer epialgicus TaxID=393907 RepID=A0ABV4P7J9_9GAMM